MTAIAWLDRGEIAPQEALEEVCDGSGCGLYGHRGRRHPETEAGRVPWCYRHDGYWEHADEHVCAATVDAETREFLDRSVRAPIAGERVLMQGLDGGPRNAAGETMREIIERQMRAMAELPSPLLAGPDGELTPAGRAYVDDDAIPYEVNRALNPYWTDGMPGGVQLVEPSALRDRLAALNDTTLMITFGTQPGGARWNDHCAEIIREHLGQSCGSTFHRGCDQCRDRPNSFVRITGV